MRPDTVGMVAISIHCCSVLHLHNPICRYSRNTATLIHAPTEHRTFPHESCMLSHIYLSQILHTLSSFLGSSDQHTVSVILNTNHMRKTTHARTHAYTHTHTHTHTHKLLTYICTDSHKHLLRHTIHQHLPLVWYSAARRRVLAGQTPSSKTEVTKLISTTRQQKTTAERLMYL